MLAEPLGALREAPSWSLRGAPRGKRKRDIGEGAEDLASSSPVASAARLAPGTASPEARATLLPTTVIPTLSCALVPLLVPTPRRAPCVMRGRLLLQTPRPRRTTP